MSYHTTDSNGISELNPTPMRMREILGSVLEDSDSADYPDAWLTHGPSGWTLTYASNKVLTLENADRDDMPSRCMRNVPLNRALELWMLLAKGDTRAVLGQDWSKI
ncbi:MAG: hypothetical protein JW942_04280 [Opitutales bacterium]|nr:hypothetical protein [Opitutales bacterium]